MVYFLLCQNNKRKTIFIFYLNVTIYQDVTKMILQIYFCSYIEFHLFGFVEDKDIFTRIFISYTRYNWNLYDRSLLILSSIYIFLFKS